MWLEPKVVVADADREVPSSDRSREDSETVPSRRRVARAAEPPRLAGPRVAGWLVGIIVVVMVLAILARRGVRGADDDTASGLAVGPDAEALQGSARDHR